MSSNFKKIFLIFSVCLFCLIGCTNNGSNTSENPSSIQQTSDKDVSNNTEGSAESNDENSQHEETSQSSNNHSEENSSESNNESTSNNIGEDEDSRNWGPLV